MYFNHPAATHCRSCASVHESVGDEQLLDPGPRGRFSGLLGEQEEEEPEGLAVYKVRLSDPKYQCERLAVISMKSVGFIVLCMF